MYVPSYLMPTIQSIQSDNEYHVHTDGSCIHQENIASYGYYIPEIMYVKVVVLTNHVINQAEVIKKIRAKYLQGPHKDDNLDISFIEYNGQKSTDLEYESFDLVVDDVIKPANNTDIITVHTDSASVIKSKMMIAKEFGFALVKELGHGRKDIINQDFKVIDKVTRMCNRMVVKSLE